MRPRRRAGSSCSRVVLALAGLLLAGCGIDIHPGAAAVVNGHVISQSQVDDLVLAACDYSRAVRAEQGGAEPTQSMGNLRTSLAGALIQFEITDEAASQLGLSVSEAKISELTSANPMPAGLSGESRDLLEGFFHDASRAQLQQAVLGAHLSDPKVTTADDVTPANVDAGMRYLDSFAAKQDVTVDPSYGSWDGSALVSSSGSLSDPVSTTPAARPNPSPDAVADLPPSQVCG